VDKLTVSDELQAESGLLWATSHWQNETLAEKSIVEIQI